MTFINLVVILDGEEPWLAGGEGGGGCGMGEIRGHRRRRLGGYKRIKTQ